MPGRTLMGLLFIFDYLFGTVTEQWVLQSCKALLHVKYSRVLAPVFMVRA